MFTAERYLGAGSALASAHPAFRVRPGQMALADAVARAFAGEGHLVAEAGTGVGKSLAYLIPAAFAVGASWCRPRPGRCRTSSAPATCRSRAWRRAAR